MDKLTKDKIQNNLKQAVDLLHEVGNYLEESSQPESITDMLNAIVGKKSRRYTAYRLDVDVSTVDRWRRGGKMRKKNRLKIEALYKELFS